VANHFPFYNSKAVRNISLRRKILRRGVVGASPKLQGIVPHLVGFPRLLFQYICS